MWFSGYTSSARFFGPDTDQEIGKITWFTLYIGTIRYFDFPIQEVKIFK